MKSSKCLSWTFSIFSALSLSSTRLRDFGIMRHIATTGDIFNLAGEFINSDEFVASARQTKKSPWQYSLEVFQGIPPRIFLAVP